MSSNIRVQRKCQHCGELFIAKTTVTKFCGDNCAKRAYKERKREESITKSIDETVDEMRQPLIEAQAKEFLNVNDLTLLIGLSRRTVYRLIKDKRLNALKLGNRFVIRRSDLNKMFE
ncbi:helix-turn-helix domain-containing protein [Pontibacter korlensis]|uniref:Helix-turn-helix domain-containing protein n=1 Tax=Pontibacter korlensis TaxID=400092 RepID=A0A0E3UXM1_9BACT|nr:helix-turn-helix domain-containing protein [Pontibacter korlensis]AKD04382.1 hypothetical protein PKOR_16420 [Pontibacter korlensis]